MRRLSDVSLTTNKEYGMYNTTTELYSDKCLICTH